MNNSNKRLDFQVEKKGEQNDPPETRMEEKYVMEQSKRLIEVA